MLKITKKVENPKLTRCHYNRRTRLFSIDIDKHQFSSAERLQHRLANNILRLDKCVRVQAVVRFDLHQQPVDFRQMLWDRLNLNIWCLLNILAIDDVALLGLLLLDYPHVNILIVMIRRGRRQIAVHQIVLECLQSVAIGYGSVYQQLLMAHPVTKEQ